MINDTFSMQSISGSHVLKKTKQKQNNQTLECCLQVTELVLVHFYSEYPLSPNSCLWLSQPQYMAVEEFCHQSQIRDYKGDNTGVLYFLFCGYSALLCQGLMLTVKKINVSLALDLWSMQGLPLCMAVPALVSTCSRIFEHCWHVLVMILS